MSRVDLLRQLVIENYGLIERGEIAFSDGATMFTGETGSGKTMLLGALGFVLGDRATVDAVRRGANKASVLLRFRLHDEDGVIIREIGVNGKSVIRYNDQVVTAAAVREIAGDIADIVGQHDAQRLLSPAYHVEVLDRFAGEKTLAARDNVRALYEQLRGIEDRLAALEGDERRARALYEDARFAAEEIDAANVQLGEDERLTERRRFLDNVERIAEALRIAHDALSGESDSARREEIGASPAIGAAGTALHGIAGISPALSGLADRVSALQEETNDVAMEIARELETSEFNPNELEEINGRLDALDKLKRKYGGTLEKVVAQAEKSRQIVADFDGRDERLVELQKQREVRRQELPKAAQTLSELRHSGAKKLVKAVSGEFADLALASGRFDVAFEPLDAIGPDGNEQIEFVFAANAGEPLRPLARVASGGELSRVLLALVVVSAEGAGPALIFDEIDTGIGGVTATAVGARLGRLAAQNQVVCVTHLAQIASWAKRHYVLEKSETKHATTIGVRELTAAKDREAELARMLSGETHEIAIEHARTLLGKVKAV